MPSVRKARMTSPEGLGAGRKVAGSVQFVHHRVGGMAGAAGGSYVFRWEQHLETQMRESMVS